MSFVSSGVGGKSELEKILFANPTLKDLISFWIIYLLNFSMLRLKKLLTVSFSSVDLWWHPVDYNPHSQDKKQGCLRCIE